MLRNDETLTCLRVSASADFLLQMVPNSWLSSSYSGHDLSRSDKPVTDTHQTTFKLVSLRQEAGIMP